MEEKRPKILVAMSGGVDSSVAAALLVQQGFDVAGAFMVNYDDQRTGINEQGSDSCWREDYRDALRVAAKLGISLIKLDFTKEYKEQVLDYMFKEYEEGRTPNPDVLCNKFIKFGEWLKKARALGFTKLATGHYAKINKHRSVNSKQKRVGDRWSLIVGEDQEKDQTYFLHQLNQEQLSHVLFPLGDYTKKEVRELARKFELPTSEKEESMGICFVGEVPMKEFLKNKIKTKIGDIVMTDGEVIGQHEGLSFYTIGQRHIGTRIQGYKDTNKLQITNDRKIKSEDSKPLYVVGKNFEKNELIVGYENDPLLWKKEIVVKDVHWISGQQPEFPLECKVRLRHRQKMQKSKVINLKSKIIIQFEKPQKAVTPGQFAVFYKDRECLGGGVIV